MKEKSGTIPKAVVTIATLNGLFLFGNGLFMLLAPSTWYYFMPGVTHTVFLISISFATSVLFRCSSWLIAHAVWHLWEVGVLPPAGWRVQRDVRRCF